MTLKHGTAALTRRIISRCRRDRETGCLEWTGALRNGYAHVRIDGESHYAHRLVVEALPGETVRHSCDNRRCVEIEHLIIGTKAENSRDMMVRGRHVTSKLTPDKVRRLRRRAASGEPQRRLAVDFGISESAVSACVHGRTWKHVL